MPDAAGAIRPESKAGVGKSPKKNSYTFFLFKNLH
jgi:hypothetical protein